MRNGLTEAKAFPSASPELPVVFPLLFPRKQKQKIKLIFCPKQRGNFRMWNTIL